MPKSKSKRRRHQPPPRKKPKPSPRWFGLSILAAMFAGVIMIVLNYLGVMPAFKALGLDVSGDTNNFYLFAGLGLIAAGFLASTQWR
jgi:Co/Zn/Cd efflux system component